MISNVAQIHERICARGVGVGDWDGELDTHLDERGEGEYDVLETALFA